MDAALLITQPFTESGGEAMFVAGFFPFIFLILFSFQDSPIQRQSNFPCFRKFFVFRCTCIVWSLLESHSVICVWQYLVHIFGVFWGYLGHIFHSQSQKERQCLLQFFLIFSFFFYRFPDWVLLDGVQWISLSIWCCVMNECRLLHENPFTTGKWYYYEKWGWFCNHIIYRPNKDSSENFDMQSCLLLEKASYFV